MTHGLHAELGGADAFDHHDRRQLGENLLLDGRRQHRGRADQHPERREIVLAFALRRDERPCEGVADDTDLIGLVLGDGAPHGVRVEAAGLVGQDHVPPR